MDWGGLLGSMALGAGAGYADAGLDEIRRDTEMAERKAMAELEYEMRSNYRDEGFALEEQRDARLFDQKKEAAEIEHEYGLEKAEALHGYDIDTLREKGALEGGLLGKRLNAEQGKYGREIKEKAGALKDIGFTDEDIKRMFMPSGRQKDVDPGDAAKLYELADARAKAKAGINGMTAPEPDQLDAYQKYYEEEVSAFSNLLGGKSDEQPSEERIMRVFEAKDEKSARAAYNALTDEEKAIAKKLYAERRAGSVNELRKDNSPLASDPIKIYQGDVRIKRDGRVIPNISDELQGSHRYGDVDAGYDW